ncbi:replication protein [Rhodococcus sp. NPDC019627]|uniref:replication protein n=1 Tax=unclassified Rhodococcus (in: high G+C Gram-positive bacteria) TaxID=192944 RepID=UPI0033F8E017
MSIRRGPRVADNFTILRNAVITDERLSYRARGVLADILSKPADWRTRAEDLARRSPTEGRDAIRTALRELEVVGYLVRERKQDPTTGRWSNESTVYEVPVDCSPEPEPGKPTSGTPNPGQPGSLISTESQRTETNHHRSPKAGKSPSPNQSVVKRFPELDALAVACRHAGLTARWDALKPETAASITELLDLHGVSALVHSAVTAHRPINPTRYAQGWIETWRALPLPRPKAAPLCGSCDEGWLPDNELGQAVKCPCRLTKAA